MRRLGSENPADFYSMGSQAELIEGMLEGLRDTGGHCWVGKRGRQASKQLQQASVG